MSQAAGTAQELRAKYGSIATRGLVVGLLGVAGLIAGFVLEEKAFFQSYMFGYIFWITITLGMLGWMLLHNMTAGKWGFTIRRFIQAGTWSGSPMRSPLLLMAILLVPILLGGYEHYYHWMHADAVATDHTLQAKSFYLNEPFWYARLAFYFLFWIWIAATLKRLLDREEETLDPTESKITRIQKISAGGLVLFMLTVNFAMTDLAMSIEAHWFSTIYGVIMLISGVLSAIAIANGTTVLSARYRPFSTYIDTKTLHDLGNLMFALTVFWAYVSFSQYMIIWSANLAEEASWYLKRTDGIYEWIGYGLLAFHFAFPFIILIQRKFKRNPHLLRRMAIYIVTMHFFNMLWQIKPAFQEVGDTTFNFHILDIAAVAGIGGLWVWMYMSALQKSERALLPKHDLRMKGAKPVVDDRGDTVTA